MAKREPLTKKLRFEVLKRDSFTCQYCGAQAPDVLLEVDHIVPVAKGGTNEITNLITSCHDCNSGKSDRKLDDSTVVVKQKAQLDELQERREQLEMMHDWQIELTTNELSGVEIVEDVIEMVSGATLTDTGRKNVRKLITQFGVSVVCDAVRTAFAQYDKPEIAFSKIGGICWCKSHVTCYTCVNYEGKTSGGCIRCEFLDNYERSVKIAERCESYKAR